MLPQYSGGLGILAGDHLKAASDLGVPIIGVGLLYRPGYFAPVAVPRRLAAGALPGRSTRTACRSRCCARPTARPLKVAVGAARRAARCTPRSGRRRSAGCPLLLLDSDVEDNAPAERDVTDRLYGGGSEHRLLQEMLLGIGGVRALRAYCRLTGAPAPEVFHTNEGHAGFLGLERIRELTEDARADLRRGARGGPRRRRVFTTHTPVPAGIDRFAARPGRPALRRRQRRAPASRSSGCSPSAPRTTTAATRASSTWRSWACGSPSAPTASAELHGHVSRGTCSRGLWPGFDEPRGADRLDHQRRARADLGGAARCSSWPRREIGRRARPRPRRPGTTSTRVPDADIWAVRGTAARPGWSTTCAQRVRRRPGCSAAPARPSWAGSTSVLDPDVLTIGFARRVPSYKRLTLMLRDPERLKALLLDPERPIQIVIAGKAHPADDGGKKLIQELVRFADDPAVRHRIVVPARLRHRDGPARSTRAATSG